MCTIWNLPVKTRSRSTLLNQGTGYHNVMRHCQKYQVTLLLSFHLQMYQVTERSISRTKKSQQTFARDLKSCVNSMAKHSSNTMRTLAEQSLQTTFFLKLCKLLLPVSLFLRCSIAACICCPKGALFVWGIFVRGCARRDLC